MAYYIFEGNKFEGHTMLSIINPFKEKYRLNKLIIVADAELLSKENITQLEKKDYELYTGAKIISESSELKEKSLAYGQTTAKLLYRKRVVTPNLSSVIPRQEPPKMHTTEPGE